MHAVLPNSQSSPSAASPLPGTGALPARPSPMWASAAFRFVLAMGLVNLFADTTYEGGASINGPFLATLGAAGAAVSIIAGVGEFLGYSLRSVSGLIADKTG